MGTSTFREATKSVISECVAFLPDGISTPVSFHHPHRQAPQPRVPFLSLTGREGVGESGVVAGTSTTDSFPGSFQRKKAFRHGTTTMRKFF